MRRRFLVPSDIAALIASERAAWPEAVTVRFRGDETLLVVTEERNDRVNLVAAGKGEVTDRIGFPLADAMAGELPVRWRGHAHRLMVEDVDGHAWGAETLVPDGDGAALLDVRLGSRGAAFRPPAWMDTFREVAGAEAFQALFGPPVLPAGKWLIDVVRPLLEGRHQIRLGMQSIVDDSIGMEPPSKWDAIRSHARDLGMALSADKADVRTALAPFAMDGGDGAAFLSGLDPQEASIFRKDGLFMLGLADGGGMLGEVTWTEASGFREGTALVGPGSRFPAVLPGDVALALASEGYHKGPDGAETGLWTLEALDRIRVVLCGIRPDALATHARWDDL
jgi:hypothetical protein